MCEKYNENMNNEQVKNWLINLTKHIFKSENWFSLSLDDRLSKILNEEINDSLNENGIAIDYSFVFIGSRKTLEIWRIKY